MTKRNRYSQTALAAVGLLTASFGLGHLSVSKAQDNPPPPPADRARPLPRGKRPPGPDVGLPPSEPVNSKDAPAAVMTANDALAGLTAGQVWTRSAPRGEQEVEATLVFNGKDVARLDFDPAIGLLRARGEGRPLPPPAPPNPGASVPPAPDAARPVPPAPDAKAPAPGIDAPAPPAAPDANTLAPVGKTPPNLDPIKANLAGIIKGLSIGQGGLRSCRARASGRCRLYPGAAWWANCTSPVTARRSWKISPPPATPRSSPGSSRRFRHPNDRLPWIALLAASLRENGRFSCTGQ